VFTGLTVAENLQVASMMIAGGATRSVAVDAIVDLLPQVKNLLPRTTDELSGGERQIVGLAMALVISPRLILLDEPSLGLAPAMVRTVLDRLQTIRQDQRTALLIVEQKIREILRIADRVYVMRNGAVSFSGCAAELRDEQRLRGVYL
jgi:branched-chain amino acid transport system ATP-binding protein